MVSYDEYRCKEGRCEGVGVDGLCGRTEDCEPGQYCERGRCRGEKGRGEECGGRYECGRRGGCLYNGTKRYRGVCVEYFSVKVGKESWNRVLNSVGGYLSKK